MDSNHTWSHFTYEYDTNIRIFAYDIWLKLCVQLKPWIRQAPFPSSSYSSTPCSRRVHQICRVVTRCREENRSHAQTVHNA